MYIAEWDWRDDDIEHMSRHGVQPAHVLAVWRGTPRYRRNRKNRSASHQMIGPDDGGRFFTIFIREDETWAGLWRAITGRGAEPPERAWWERS